jgi:hypothetical protein
VAAEEGSMKAADIKRGCRVLWRGSTVEVIDAERVWEQEFTGIRKVGRTTNAVLARYDDGRFCVVAVRHACPIPDAALLDRRRAVEAAEQEVKRHDRPDWKIVNALVAGSRSTAYALLDSWQTEHEQLVAALKHEQDLLAKMEGK